MVRHEEHSVQFYEEKLEANSQSLVFSRLADCYRKKGEIQQAIGVCMQGLKIHPDYVTGRVILGRCYLEQEKLKEATAEFIRVVGLDRRNQVAVKMIADVYARQGMKEKAGDLYAYLLRMDPDNQSLEKCVQSNRGNGEANVLRILGIASQPQNAEAPAVDEMQVPQASPDTIADVDKTIQMDMVPRFAEGGLGDTAELGEMLVKTQRFDAEELTESAQAGAYRVEETVSDSSAKQGDVITGDDISSRMAMIFGEEEAKSTQAGLQTAEAPAEAMDIVPDTTDTDADADAQKVHDDTVTTTSPGATETAAAPIVSGSDITSRIEQLFGDEMPTAQPDLSADAISDFTQAYVPGPAAEEATMRVSDTPVSVPPQAPVKEPKATESGDISGEDVTDRLNEMFSESSSISEPLAEIGKMLDEQAPLAEPMETEPAGSEMHDELTAESADDGAGLALDESESSHEESLEAVSGEDVALRLETIFEEAEKNDASSDASSDTGAITVTEDVAPRPEEETKSPFDVSDIAIVIGGDIADSDIHEAGEATLFAAETPAEEATGHEGAVTTAEPAMDIDDPMPQETQPEMSGDDVVGRLDELFSENLTKDAGLDSIPDGDKDDDEVNQGFYTMSGGNAQTAASEEGLLSQLDGSDSEEPEKETLDPAREPEDKTVLMEQDDQDLTLAVAEEETIFSDSRKPLQKLPLPLDGNDDVIVNEATQISLPTADEQPREGAGSQYSIPDHVLTPTLADIYYQQGQPALALQIYKRLLEADPDNDIIADRIQEIKRAVAAQEAKETALLDSGAKSPAGIPGKAASNRKKTDVGKPLAGVRIKKVYKNRIRKSR